jgi:ribonuclease M5
VVSMKQAVVVEGRYDKNTLAQLIDAPIFETNGFGVMNDPELVALLRRAAETRGLVILTDSDGAGFVIRNYLKGVLPKENVLHAYIPDIPGKERRKTVPGKEGKLGVEGMRPDVILQALRNAGAELDGQCAAHADGQITKADLYALGFSGRSDSAQRRAALVSRLGLPAHISANALLQALNLLYSREAFLARIQNEEKT